MKLYATVYPDRVTRPSKKGGDKYLSIELTKGNLIAFNIMFDGDTLDIVNAEGKNWKIQGEKLKGEKHKHDWETISPNVRSCKTCNLVVQE